MNRFDALSLRERLARGSLVLDGAMGTELYRRGQFINKPFEGVNIAAPDLVEAIHAEYVEAGAQALETNTFAGNRWKLRAVGLEEHLEAINRAGVTLARRAANNEAWVLGSVGPSGIRWREARAQQRLEAAEVLAEQVAILLDAGVDGLVLETFAWLEELLAVLERIRPLTEIPIFAQVAFLGEGVTLDGASPDRVAEDLDLAGADVLGANCADGPMELYAIAEKMLGTPRPVAVLPNAGYPKQVDGRMIYMATPEYFAVFARRFLKLGVRVLGGCCGTTPEHVRSMVGASRMFNAGENGGNGEPVIEVRESASAPVERLPEVPLAERSRLGARIAADDGFVVSVEVNPPTGLDMRRAVEAARMLKAAGVDVINIADGPRASVRMSNWALALEVQREVGMESIVHVCARDRNLIGLQSDLLAYHRLALSNLVIITGDPPKLGDYPNATPVFDLDSVRLLRLARDFNEGVGPNGQPMVETTSFVLACGAEPAALDYDRELRRLEAKVAAGADFIMTQPVYDPAVLERFLRDIEGFSIPVLVGLMPLASARNAEFLHNEVPGMQIPPAIRERMAAVDRGPEARQEGVRIAQEALVAVRDQVRGAYIMPPFGRYEAAIEILEVIGYERPASWIEGWRA